MSFFDLFRRPAGRQPSAEDTEIPRYPPFVKGLPVPPTQEILQSQDQIIRDISQALGCTHEVFDEMVRPLIVRYAEYVHLLPASERHHHRGAGGLFRHGLEVAFHAARASRDKLYAMDRDKRDRDLIAMRWRIAATVAGLCHDVGKPAYDMSVIDRDGTRTWEPGKDTIVQWARANQIDRYFIRWREQRHSKHEKFGAVIFGSLIASPEIMGKFMQPEPAIMDALLDALSGTQNKSTLTELVAIGEERSVGKDLRENNYPAEMLSVAVPVERYLVDAMRQLVRSTRWQINTGGHRLWMLPDGLYIVWPEGCEDVIDVLRQDKIPGIPRDPDTVADILIDRGLALAQDAAGRRRYWRKAPAPLAREGKPVTLTMLRLADPETIVAFPPPPVALVPEPAGATTPPVASQPTAPSGTAAPGADGGQDLTDPTPAAQVFTVPPRTVKHPRADRGPTVVAQPDAVVTAVRQAARANDTARGIATDWLHRYNPGGQALIDLMAWWHTRADLDLRVCLDGERLRLLYPGGLGEDDPVLVLNQLDRAGLLDTGPNGKRLTTRGAHAYAWLTSDATRRVRTLLEGTVVLAAAEAVEASPVPSQAARRGAAEPGEDRPSEPHTTQPTHPPGGSPITPMLIQTFVDQVRAGQLEAQWVAERQQWRISNKTAQSWIAAMGGRLGAFRLALQNHPACQGDEHGIWVRREDHPAGGESS